MSDNKRDLSSLVLRVYQWQCVLRQCNLKEMKDGQLAAIKNRYKKENKMKQAKVSFQLKKTGMQFKDDQWKTEENVQVPISSGVSWFRLKVAQVCP